MAREPVVETEITVLRGDGTQTSLGVKPTDTLEVFFTLEDATEETFKFSADELKRCLWYLPLFQKEGTNG